MCLPGKPDDLNSVPGTHFKKPDMVAALVIPAFTVQSEGDRDHPEASLDCVAYRSYKRDPGLSSPSPHTLGLSFCFGLLNLFLLGKTFRQLKLNLLNINLL